jgi:UMF1 family MFS transporter
MVWIGPGDWVLAAALYALGNVGAAGSLVFADALLPSVARGRELDRVATSGFALGYLSGGLLIALAVWMTVRPETFGLSGDATLPARVMFALTAVWWGLFSLPILLWVKEPPASGVRGERAFQAGLARLGATLRELRRYRQAAKLLVAMLIYLDGVLTVIRMATIYGEEIGIGEADLFKAVLLVQFVAVPCSALFGLLAGRIGAKGAILLSLAIYVAICVLAWRMSSTAEYYLMAALVGTAQGGCQALSRSLFASMVPPEKAGEFFGLFGVLEKFAGVLGPAAFGATIELTGSPESGMLALVVFFLLGGFLLWRVDVEEGRRVARGAERQAAGLTGASPPPR